MIRREHLQLALMLVPTFLVAAALVVTLSTPGRVATAAASPDIAGVPQLVALDTETGPLLAVAN